MVHYVLKSKQKINKMNFYDLEAKILSLVDEQLDAKQLQQQLPERVVILINKFLKGYYLHVLQSSPLGMLVCCLEFVII